MLINANSNSQRTEILIQEYLKLIKTNNSEDILVLVQNSKKKHEWLNKIKENSPVGNIGNLKIYSFFGLCYNYILQNWGHIEESIKNTNNAKIIPNLCGLEVSQYIFKQCIKEVDFTGYNSKTSLLHQLLRRNSLINLNNLTKEEINTRSKILQESFTKEVNSALDKYKIKTINFRAFDYIRQLNLFEFLYKKLKNNFSYVFVDDADEITPATLEYLKFIKPDIKEFFIAYDELGSSRLGYLGAINVDFEEFLNEKAIKLNNEDLKTKNSIKIFNSLKNDELIDLNDFSDIKSNSFLKRNEMIDALVSEIKKLVKNGTSLSEISIVTPICDDFLKTSLKKSGFEFNFLTKNEKLNQNKYIGYILDLLKLFNDAKNTEVSYFTLKGIFIELLNFNKIETIKLIQEYKIERQNSSINIFDLIRKKKEPKFQKLIEIFEKTKFEKLSLQFFEIVTNFITLDKEISKDIIKINQLLKQIYDFESVFKDKVSNNDLLIQLENTIISENPLSDDEIDENSIVVSSAQKLIDYSIKTKYQFLLDITNENWLKQDIGPLYNAWVMQKSWKKDVFELQDNINLTKDRTARTLHKLYLLGENNILYSSVYDSVGLENFSGIDKFFKFVENKTTSKDFKPITPRPDQQAVLDYKGGKMAVSATAGSGKTTIMLLLVDKILNGEILKNVEANEIFVLTFMESAARNFKERIKAKYPNLKELPNISTIHGLALRIIKENNNFSKLGLDDDFEIIDEIKRTATINEIVYSVGLPVEKASLYDSMISAYKNELAQDENFKTDNKPFLSVFENYQKRLKEENLIDYDDLLLLSLKLLRQNKDVLSYYQNLAKVIIEDEAQDSSYIQQNLILLLAGKFNNIIRCGDINQAITSTFTNSDVEGFRNYMKTSALVEMDRCQRCATGVLDCANATVEYAKKQGIEAFSTLFMKPVENKNIVDKNAVSDFVFENEEEEKKFVIEKIQEILKQDKKATIGLLLRSNFAIEKWDKIFKNYSLKTFKNQDCLINNPVFKVTLLILEYIKDPYDLKLTKNLIKTLFEMGFYDYETLKYVEDLKIPLFLDNNLDIQFVWDMNYFLYKNHYSIYELVQEIGESYFEDSNNKENIPLVSIIVHKIFQTQKTFEKTVAKLREIQYKNNFANIKFFNNENKEDKTSTIQIMTLHKSKGDEFDYVFIPELTQDNLCLTPSELKLKENTKFCQKIKKIKKTDEELQTEIVEENYRLIYVGITRAKKKLYLTTSNTYKFFSKVREFKNSEIFDLFKK